MTQSRFDTAEVLCQHIPLIYSKLDSIRAHIFATSELSNALLKSKDGLNIQEFIADYQKSLANKEKSHPKPSKSNLKLISDSITKISAIVRCADYAVLWAIKARETIIGLANNSIEFDIRWNHQYTLMACELFVAFTKVCLYFFQFPVVSICTHMWQHHDELHKIKLANPINQLIPFISQSTRYPFTLLREGTLQLQHRFGQLISQVGPFLIQVFSEWPLCDWQQFAIFHRATKIQTDSSLPNTDYLALSHIELLKDFVFFFTLSFKKYTDDHPQFLALLQQLRSESHNIQLTQSLSIPIEKVSEAAAAAPEEKDKAFMTPLLQMQLNTKRKMSHSMRLSHLLVLIRDIANISEFDCSYLPRLTYNVMALGAFASYEINSSFIDQTEPSEEVAALLHVTVQIAKQFLRNDAYLKRFFVFNLATTDLVYLRQIVDQFSTTTFDWQLKLIDELSILVAEMETLDLDAFDQGTRYNFQPFMMTIGRLLDHFNQLKQKQHVAYLHPIFEHLETIRTHMKFASSPIEAFVSYVPLHRLWRFGDQLVKYVQKAPGGAQYIGSICTLFAIFNLDYVSLTESEQKRLTNVLQTIRGDLITMAYSLMINYLDEDSKTMNLSQISRFERLFEPEYYTHSGNDGSVEAYEDEAELLAPVWQMKELMQELPDIINFAGQDVKMSSFIASKLTSNLTQILFKSIVPDPLWVDSCFSAATEFIWPLFSLLGVSFTYKLYQCRFESSMIETNVGFLDLVSRLKLEEERNTSDSKNLIISFMEFASQFIHKNSYDEAIFFPHSHRFVATRLREDTETDPYYFFSLESFKYLVVNLGLHAGFNLDRFLIHQAGTLMIAIYTNYQSMLSQLNTWYQDYQANGCKWKEAKNNPTLNQSLNKMLRLGVVLAIRKILRDAMHDVTDQGIPGYADLMTSAYARSYENLSEKEDLLLEMVAGIPYFHFIEQMLLKKNIQKTTDSMQFFFFLALCLMDPSLDDTVFVPQNECFTHNLHLYPYAMNAFISILSTFCVASDYKTVSNGLGFFFIMMSHIILDKRSINANASQTFVILIDLFPQYINGIEYGRIQASFPSSVISEAYDAMAKREIPNVTAAPKLKTRKQREEEYFAQRAEARKARKGSQAAKKGKK